MTTGAHPDKVLYAETRALPELAAVEHYAGNEKTMRKALGLQAERGARFDITLDCEDGAAAGAERDHAELIAALIMSAENRFNRVGARVHDLTHPAWRTALEPLVGLAGTLMNVLKLGELLGGTAERPIAVIASTLTFVALLVYLVLGVTSFIRARRYRRA